MAEVPEMSPGLVRQIEAIDTETYYSEHGLEFSGFASMYYLLPEVPMAATIGADLTIRFGTEACMRVKAIAAYGGSLVVRNLAEPDSTDQDRPDYYLLRGSFYFPEAEQAIYGSEAVQQTAVTLLNAGNPDMRKMGSGIRVAYTPLAFCRDGQLVYAPAHTLADMRSDSMRTRAGAKPICGMHITVPSTPLTSLSLFVENNYQLSPRITGIEQDRDGHRSQLLLYIQDEDAESH